MDKQLRSFLLALAVFIIFVPLLLIRNEMNVLTIITIAMIGFITAREGWNWWKSKES